MTTSDVTSADQVVEEKKHNPRNSGVFSSDAPRQTSLVPPDSTGPKPKNPHDVAVGKRLREARLALGLTQAEVAGLIGLKQSNHYSHCEQGKKPAGDKVLDGAAEHLGHPREWFETGVMPDKPAPPRDQLSIRAALKRLPGWDEIDPGLRAHVDGISFDTGSQMTLQQWLEAIPDWLRESKRGTLGKPVSGLGEVRSRKDTDDSGAAGDFTHPSSDKAGTPSATAPKRRGRKRKDQG
jgi:transcriptional regulator with XRE-family HTH domain